MRGDFNPRGVRPTPVLGKFKIWDFNPRTPRGVRHPAPLHGVASLIFQSTHPSRGATVATGEDEAEAGISIHAPLAGCDRPLAARKAITHYFNPRTPRGVRQRHPRPAVNDGHFNPRTPRGVRLLRRWLPQAACQHFNPRTPRGVRQYAVRTSPRRSLFQSTHPSRGATQNGTQSVINENISIHAPLAGCDTPRVTSSRMSTRFQSTHPSRGATSGAARLACQHGNFNPRTPRGVRPNRRMILWSLNNFNPRTPRGVRLLDRV